MDELRLILVGDAGAGKSSTGNSILGRREFETRDSGGRMNRECQRGEGLWGGRPLVVVDTPSFLLLSRLIPAQEPSAETERCLQLSAPGPHALLFVLRPGRFTWAEWAAQRIQRLFGAEVLQRTVLVFTRMVELKGKSIETFLRESRNVKELVRRCGGRVCVFNNRATGTEREQQVWWLMQVIDKMMEGNGGRCLGLGQDQEAPGEDQEPRGQNRRFKDF